MNFFPNVYFFGESLWNCKQVCYGNVDLAETGPKCRVGIKFEEVEGRSPMLLLPILCVGGKRL